MRVINMPPYESCLLTTTATNQNPQMLNVENLKTLQTKYWFAFKTLARGTRAFAYLGTHTHVCLYIIQCNRYPADLTNTCIQKQTGHKTTRRVIVIVVIIIGCHKVILGLGAKRLSIQTLPFNLARKILGCKKCLEKEKLWRLKLPSPKIQKPEINRFCVPLHFGANHGNFFFVSGFLCCLQVFGCKIPPNAKVTRPAHSGATTPEPKLRLPRALPSSMAFWKGNVSSRRGAVARQGWVENLDVAVLATISQHLTLLS